MMGELYEGTVQLYTDLKDGRRVENRLIQIADFEGILARLSRLEQQAREGNALAGWSDGEQAEALRAECERLQQENHRLRAALNQLFSLSDRLEANTRKLEQSR